MTVSEVSLSCLNLQRGPSKKCWIYNYLMSVFFYLQISFPNKQLIHFLARDSFLIKQLSTHFHLFCKALCLLLLSVSLGGITGWRMIFSVGKLSVLHGHCYKQDI